jgi:hypothetical protein
MAFEIDKGETYDWPVICGDPVDGEYKKESFIGVFNNLGQARINKINDLCRQRQIAELSGESTEGMINDMQLADEVLAGWKKITQNGEPYEFDEARKQALLSKARVAGWVVDAWSESVRGGAARKKTSRTPLGIG